MRLESVVPGNNLQWLPINNFSILSSASLYFPFFFLHWECIAFVIWKVKQQLNLIFEHVVQDQIWYFRCNWLMQTLVELLLFMYSCCNTSVSCLMLHLPFSILLIQNICFVSVLYKPPWDVSGGLLCTILNWACSCYTCRYFSRRRKNGETAIISIGRVIRILRLWVP